MENISYVGLSQQVALQRELEITANNMANMDTPGYKAQSVLFLEYMNKGGDEHAKLKQVNDYGLYRDLAVGAFRQTFNKLDVAIEGEGYFAVQGPGGDTLYTRDGGFALNEQRQVVSKAGYPILGENDAPIVIPPDAADIAITENGEIVTELGAAGRLKLVDFENPQALKPVGSNMLSAQRQDPLPATGAKVEQGMIESSNVNPIVEMNKMIKITRMYEATQRMLIDDHKRILGAIEKLTRTS